MLKTKKIVVANWKMNPQWLSDGSKIISSIKRFSPKIKRTGIIICPPFLFLSAISKSVGKNKKISIGSQNSFYENSGSFTGEISPTMLANIGIQYAIIGHSERRNVGEDSEIVSRKAVASLNAGIIPIICIGERNRDQHGDYLQEIKNQINKSLNGILKKDIVNIVLAYEPVWAIGAKTPMNSNEIHETSIYIKKILTEMYGKESAFKVKILYGGSVFAKNAQEIMKNGNIDGLLVGRDSLDAKNFCEICKIVDEI